MNRNYGLFWCRQKIDSFIYKCIATLDIKNFVTKLEIYLSITITRNKITIITFDKLPMISLFQPL